MIDQKEYPVFAQLTMVLKKNLAFIKSARFRNRGGKLYLTVKYKRDGDGDGELGGKYSLHQTVRAAIAHDWPKAYCTSGGPHDCTFRLNP